MYFDVDVDVIVIGAGAVGLACGSRFAEAGRSTLVLEASEVPGSGCSSRNSEVVHAGLYYPTGSLKHRLCLRGRRRLYEFLGLAGLGHRKCGKIVVATNEEEMSSIEALHQRSVLNGVEGVSLIGRQELASLEPEVRGIGGLMSAETGIFDSHGYLLSLWARLESFGGSLVCRSPVKLVRPERNGYSVVVGGSEPATILTRMVVNSAGLFAHDVARSMSELDPAHIPRQYLAKGSYFSLRGRSPFKHLIYPAPVDGGLGVHATMDMDDRVRFGPDVEWLPNATRPGELDYAVDPGRRAAFASAIAKYWPAISEDLLSPDYSGCRPKISGPGTPAADFMIQSDAVHGLPGVVNLFGIESPGLTSSLAIADFVLELLEGNTAPA